MQAHLIGQDQSCLDTPALKIDLTKLKSNIKKMAEHGQTHQVGIRPHCKTHKCSKIAQLQQEAGAIGISAAKLSEAEVLIESGIQKVLITSPIVCPNKFPRLARCLQQQPELILVVDHPENLAQLNQLGLQLQQKIKILVDIDGGIGRTGVALHDALDFAKSIQNFSGLALSGIQCYAGHLQHIQDYAKRRSKSLAIMQQAKNIQESCLTAGLPAQILTGSGTGTYDIDIEAGVSEIQPGSYVVMDVEYHAIGSKTKTHAFQDFQTAMHLVTSVISANQEHHVTVDAGTKSMYFDLHHRPEIQHFSRLHYDWGGFGDEHGKVSCPRDQRPSLGQKLEMVVPHCDPTINLYDEFFVIENNIIVDIWKIDLRGKSQ